MHGVQDRAGVLSTTLGAAARTPWQAGERTAGGLCAGSEVFGAAPPKLTLQLEQQHRPCKCVSKITNHTETMVLSLDCTWELPKKCCKPV